MKRIIFLFLCIGLFLISAVAQKGKPSGNDTTSVNSKSQKPLVFRPAPETGFYFHPGDSLRYKEIPRYRLPKQYPGSLQQQLLAERRSPIDNMPIIGSSGYYYFRTPVYKPDTTIDYKLRIKKIQRFSTPRIKP